MVEFKKYFNINFEINESTLLHDLIKTFGTAGYSIYNTWICYNSVRLAAAGDFEKKVFALLGVKNSDLYSIELYTKLVSSVLNELSSQDIKSFTTSKSWFCIDLANLYTVELGIRDLSEAEYKIFFPRVGCKDVETLKKMLTTKLAISILTRDGELILINKNNKPRDDEDVILNMAKQFKRIIGYKLCFPPEKTKILMTMRYTYKMFLEKPVKNEFISKKNSVENIIQNKSYKKPIWIKPVKNLWGEKKEMKEFLDKEVNLKFLDVLNFLSSVEFKIDYESWKGFYKMAENYKIYSWQMVTKYCLIGHMIADRSEKDFGVYEKTDDFDSEKARLSASTIELINTQIKDIENYFGGRFYSNYRIDSRYRIYQQTWPLNYQLNHFVRNSILVVPKENIKTHVEWLKKNFLSLETVAKEINPNWNIYFSKDIDIDKFLAFILENCGWSLNRKDWIEVEALLMLINALIVEGRNLNEKIEHFYKNFDFYKNLSIEEAFIFYKKKKSLKTSLQLARYCQILKNISKQAYSAMYWADASNNVIQLQSMRMGIDENKNEEIFKIFNIFNNTTRYDGAYSYVVEELKKSLEKINKLVGLNLSLEEFKKITTKEDVKKIVMPRCYGMTLFTAVDKLLKEYDERGLEFWNDLPFAKKREFIEIICKEMFSILKDLGFDIEEYRDLFKKSELDSLFYWENDYNLPVIIQTLKKSKRSRIRDEMAKLKLEKKKYKKNLESFLDSEENRKVCLEKIKNIDSKIKKYVKKDNEDEKKFYHRMVVKIKDEDKITVRIPKSVDETDDTELFNSIIPGSIHSLDSSIMFLTTEILKDLNIPICVIHDSIGTTLTYMPVVRLVFLIANVIILRKTTSKAPFPFKEVRTINEGVYRKIIESKTFFR